MLVGSICVIVCGQTFAALGSIPVEVCACSCPCPVHCARGTCPRRQFLVWFNAELIEQGANNWSQEERYQAFRFEVGFDKIGVGDVLKRKDKEALVKVHTFVRRVKETADENACFGWIQLIIAQSKVVGEVRCQLPLALFVVERVAAGEILFYDDTRIQYHFVDFPILPATRLTCFAEPPHQCPPETTPAYIDPNIIWPGGIEP